MAEFVTDVAAYRAPEAWDGETFAEIGGARAMLLWTDRPYHWHVNRADELFCVVSGRVEMSVRNDRGERSRWLETGDMALIRQGESHVAAPDGEARILIVAAPSPEAAN